MCGIFGIHDTRHPLNMSRERLAAIADLISHRGPDAAGYHLDTHIALAHRRLKIIDLEGGVQPMYTADESVVLVFNGEIYNYKALRQSLINKGHAFRTHSDTEVILAAYREYGEGCFSRLRGMFSIALYDRKKDLLLLARDRLGIKPLYLYQDGSRMTFGSEIKPILEAMQLRPTANVEVLDFYVSVGYVPGEETLFSGIRKLPPGHYLKILNGQVEESCFWDISDTPVLDIDFADASTSFESVLMESVQLHLESDVPLGAFLSGGVDSSVIVALMSKLQDQRVKTFSVGYSDDPASSELKYARMVADIYQTEHHEYILESLDFFNSLDLLLKFTEEPIVESAAVALYQLSLLAREHVTVILSGEGGDEVLAGYPLYQLMRKVDRVRHTLGRVPLAGKLPIPALFPDREKLIKYWDWINTPLEYRYQGISNDVTPHIKKHLYTDEMYETAGSRTSTYFHDLFCHLENASDLKRMSYVDMKTWLPDDLLIKADKMTMAASLELRVPFLDHAVVEYGMQLPDNCRISEGQGKYLLKKLAEKYLPREIIYRKKQGFPVPIAVWFRDKLHHKIREILLDPKALGRGYFRPDYVQRILDIHRSGKQDLSRRIFTLLAIELWHQMYIDT